MNTDEIKAKLDQLGEFQAQKDIATIAKQDLINDLYPAELKKQIADIEFEFKGQTEAVDANIAALKLELVEAVKGNGKTVKSTTYQAVWSKGRFSYSEKEEEGYVSATVYRKTGEPSVSFRTV